MKKLNRKGFTLVELLAVIIILAIVVGITIPAVLTTTNKAKEKAFQTAADTAADWFDRQYQVALTGLDSTGIATLDTNFTSACDDPTSTGTDYSLCTATTGVDITSSSIMASAGLKSSNVEKMNVKINSSTGRTCVELTAKNGGDYYGVKSDNKIKSSNCP